MECRCPYDDCRIEFASEEDRQGKVERCPSCAREITLRSLARFQEIDRVYAKLLSSDALCGTERDVRSPYMVAVLEEIRSLWNVGSIFRSSDGAGFSKLFLVGITGYPPRKEIAKTSLGAEDSINWQYSPNSLSIIKELRSQGIQIVGLEKTPSSTPLNEALSSNKLRAPLCLVVGNEVQGVYAETLAHCDIVCHLPMRGIKESLNVAVAFGIAAYAIADFHCHEQKV